MRDDHLSAEDLAAYLDGRLAPGDRTWMEAHLTQCDRCLNEVVETLRYLGRADRPSWSSSDPSE